MSQNKEGQDHVFCRVPASSKDTLMSITLVRLGLMTSLSQFYIGATLGHSLTLMQAMIASLLGSLLLEVISILLGMIGAKEGLSTSMLMRFTGFGRAGSIILASMIAVSTLGWFGFQNALLARSITSTFEGKIDYNMAAILGGLCITLLVAFGFKGLGWAAKIAVPLFIIVVSWVLVNMLSDHSFAEVLKIGPSGEPMTVIQGAGIVAGSFALGALLTPDITRYCKSSKDVIWMVTISIVVGEIIMISIGAILAHMLRTNSVVDIMMQSAGWIGLLSMILGVVKLNDVNLYAASLATISTLENILQKKFSYGLITVLLGIIGTSLSLTNIMDQFAFLLEILGIILSPVAGVMATDYYLVRSYRKILDDTRANGTIPDTTKLPWFEWSSVVSCAVAIILGLNSNIGVPSLNSLVIASVLYWVLKKAFPSKVKHVYETT